MTVFELIELLQKIPEVEKNKRVIKWFFDGEYGMGCYEGVNGVLEELVEGIGSCFVIR